MIKKDIIVSIIFPSYNGENVIYDCINSIKELKNIDEIEVIIIDNNSKDTTKDVIKKFKEFNIKLIEMNKNIGFAKACNIGALKAKGKFIFITNQDIVFPKNFFIILLNLYNKIKFEREIVISPAIVFPGKYINYFGAKIHFLGFSYTPQMYKKMPKEKITFKTKKLSGCSMFIKRENYIKLNGFDPFFFMYHEDTDFSLKAIRNNFLLYSTNETYLLHKKLHMVINNFSYYYIERNRYLVIYKNIEKILTILPYLIISEIMLIFQAILTRRIKIRLKIYKFFIQKYKFIRKLRFSDFNQKHKLLKKSDFDRNLDSILLGKVLTYVKILKFFLKLINLIL